MKEEKYAVSLSGDDVLRYEESVLYEEKIRRLEDSISTLRMSRRILMSLLEQMQAAHRFEAERLRKDNNRLKRQLHATARQMWQQNTERLTMEKERSETP